MILLADRPTLQEPLTGIERQDPPTFASARAISAKDAMSIRSRLAEAEWMRIVQVLPCRTQARARNNGNAREFVEAVLWVACTNLYWKSMPEEYGDPHTNYMRFVRWAHAGIWDQVLSVMDDSSESFAHLHRLVYSYRNKSTMMNLAKALSGTDGEARMPDRSNQSQESARHEDPPQHGYSGNA